jgi:hypothetical protein
MPIPTFDKMLGPLLHIAAKDLSPVGWPTTHLAVAVSQEVG